jgi:glycosyltransferase involved in cell wall biosynthesis
MVKAQWSADMPGSGRGGDDPGNKLVFVNRYFFPDESATSRMLSDLAFRLARQGLSVSIVTSRQLYGDADAALAPLQIVGGVTVLRVSTATFGRTNLLGRALDYASFHCAAATTLLRIVRRGDVVVAKTDPPLISIVTSWVVAWRGARLVNWLQDLFPEVATALAPKMLPWLLTRVLLAARDRSLRRAAVNVVLSEGMRQRLVARKIDSRTISTVANWADTRRVAPLPADSSRTRLDLGLTGRFVVGYSGNLGRAHEFETLLGAARLLRGDRRFVFLMTGGGARTGGLRASAQSEGLDSFRFQDYQPPERLGDSLAASDLHLVTLLPALEGLIVPSKIYGILAAGRPAVFIGDTAGDIAGMLREHTCGIAVATGDCEALAAGIRALAEDPARCAMLGHNARRLAVARYTSEHAVAAWLQILNSMAPSVIRAETERSATL